MQEKDVEIAKMRDKTSDKAQESLKDELRRAYDVLRHLKKKVGQHAFNEEYGIVMTEIRNALNMPHPEKKNKRRKTATLKAVKEPVYIESDDASADEQAATSKAGTQKAATGAAASEDDGTRQLKSEEQEEEDEEEDEEGTIGIKGEEKIVASTDQEDEKNQALEHLEL